MSRVANTYWVDERIESQRVAPRAVPMASVQQISRDLIGTRTEVRRRGGLVPAWVGFGMIILAIAAVCVTVNMRTYAKGQIAAGQFAAVESDVQTLRNLNESLRNEVGRLKNDPRTIELAARSRLNMIRSNEYVVPTVESR